MTPQEFFSSCLAPFVLVFGFVKFMFNGIVALAYKAIKFAAPTLAKHRDIVGLGEKEWKTIAERLGTGRCPVPLTVRGTQALVSFAPLAFKLFCAARQNAVLRRSPFPPV